MPVKTHKANHHNKKHPKHYAKVYWPYLPLVIVVGMALWLSYPSVARSQKEVLSYSTNVSSSQLLEVTNKTRTQDSKNTLVMNDQLSTAAQAKAEDMVKRNYWSHVTPDGQAPWIFIDQTGYKYENAAENLAYGFGDSKETIKGWLNSPEHRANLLGSEYTEVGFGVANSENYQNSGSQTVVVAMYAKPASSPETAAVLGASDVTESTKTISKAQALTNGSLPWIGFVLGLIAGSAIVYLLVKHSVAVHRAIRKGERFVLKHPVWDITIVALIALCAILSQSVGVIR